MSIVSKLLPRVSAIAVTETARAVGVPSLAPPPVGLTLTRPFGSMTLRPVQEEALAAILHSRGGVLPIGVGHGKTLISYLAPTVLGAKRPLLLLPSAMVAAAAREFASYASHFVNPKGMRVLAYSALSTASGARALDEYEPDLIIADEAHKLRHRTAARTKRVERYIHEHRPMFLAMSGTLTAKSIKDFAHLVFWALGEQSPMPLVGYHLDAWAACVDVGGIPTGRDWSTVRPLLDRFSVPADTGSKKHNVRVAFQRRMNSAPGVVATQESSVDCALTFDRIDGRRCPLPSRVGKLIAEVQATGMTPDKEDVMEDDVSMWRLLRQLSLGFWYKWDWDAVGGKDHEWLEARSGWHRWMRRELQTRSAPGYDSPLLVRNTLTREDRKPGELLRWEAVSDRPVPPTVAVWESSEVMSWVLQTVRAAKDPTLIWYESVAVGEALAALGIPLGLSGRVDTCALRIRVHGVGQNLQGWSSNLIIEPPPSGAVWEQLLGRTHRAGQTADEVRVAVLSHTGAFQDAWTKARVDAQYLQASQGQKQKLLLGTIL